MRTALVTGGGTGIGRATALAFGRLGWRVAVAGRRLEPLRETAGLLADCLVLVGDHAREEDAARMVAEAVAAFGGLDVLVNNAGSIRRNIPLHEVSAALWDGLVDQNLRGPFLMAREALRAMVRTHAGDRAIVNVSSTLARSGSPGVAPYSAAKAGVLALTRSIAVEYGGYGIRCNAVCPHVVETPLARTDRPDWPGFRAEASLSYPLGRIGQPEDVAEAIVYLASQQSAWVTGAVLDVDGGISAR